MRIIALALAFSGLSALPLRAQQAPNPLPPGPGSDIVAQACTACHRINAVTQLREGQDAWRHQVHDMVQRGAQVSQSEMDTVVTYLTTNFGPGVPFPNAPPVHVTLPEGQGKEVVEGTCGLCHGLDRVADTKRTPEQWRAIVVRMTYLGAPLSDDAAKSAEAYLGTNFSQ
jgi:mono/diheme cytochrome c family protein